MEDNRQGKRVAQEGGMSPAAKRGLIVIAAVLAALCAAYLGLCAWAGAVDTTLPRTTAAGVDVGGLTRTQAEDKLESALMGRFQSRSVSITVTGAPNVYTVTGDAVAADVASAAAAAWDLRQNSFLVQGWNYLYALLHGHEVEVPVQFTPEGEQQVDNLLQNIESELGGLVQETTWEVDGADLVFHMGTPGRAIDMGDVKTAILERFASGETTPIQLTTVTVDPAPVDMEQVHREVYAEVKDASLDPQTFEITPSTTGLDFDVDAALSSLGIAAWGADVRVPLTVTQPSVSTESLKELLFRDVLGEATSKVSGSANRKSNVALAASTYNDRILLPGEVFSYNDSTGSRTAAKGYLMAPVYKGGKSVDEVGGGICQPSSTLYYATLLANLKIVERHNHSFAVGYVPDGNDATVYYGSLDFRFENNTQYPIKLVANSYKKDGVTYLTVTIYGTKTDDLHVELTHKRYNDLPATTVYEIDPSLPAGSTRVEDTPYTGRTVETYRNIYNSNGELVSSTLESISKYKKRDKLIMVSPYDAAQYGLTAEGFVQPTPSPTPVPEPTPTPDTPLPEPSAVPEVTPPPAVSEPPAATEPVPPSESIPVEETPAVQPTPEIQPAPEVLPTPAPTGDMPDIGIPIASAAPDAGTVPQAEGGR